MVFLIGEINHVSAARVMMQMLYLEDQKRGQDINLYINSPGGAVDDTLALYDTMQFISAPVATYCIGRAYSGGAVLLCSGAVGRRHILPHAKVMIHQPYGGISGQTTDVQIQAEQILKAKRTLNEIIARHSGQDVEQVEKDGERDKFFTADEGRALTALEYLLQRTYGDAAEPRKILVDAEGYREQREEGLRQRAAELAQAVSGDGETRSTEPLNSYERRIVHMVVADLAGVSSRSEGQGSRRRVLIESA